MGPQVTQSKYNDVASTIQVIGCIMRDPTILDNVEYFFSERDFTNDLHRVVFGAAYNQYKLGTTSLSVETIEDYLSYRPESNAVYHAYDGRKWLQNAIKGADVANFPYYYGRVKKMTLFRGYEEAGVSLDWLYDPNSLFGDPKELERQENHIDSLSLSELADEINDRILDVRAECVDNVASTGVEIGHGIDQLLDRLREEPDMGAPLYGRYMNTVHRGARLGKFYIRSAATGMGKSRTMMADACTMSCDEIYDTNKNEWVENGIPLASMYISTELQLDELQTMALAFLSAVNEEHIKTGDYEFGEVERVRHAADVLKRAPLYIEVLFDYSVRDVENIIKLRLRKNKVQYVFLDYLSTSMGILEEISKRSGGVKLREDNILFLFSTKLKDIANDFNVFIETATQLNASYKTDDIPDQNLLRGAKSIADRIDVGMILLNVTKADQENIQSVVTSLGCPMPNVKLSVYKNRSGSFVQMYLWMYADKGTCRFDGLFATDYYYNYVPISDTEIKVVGGAS